MYPPDHRRWELDALRGLMLVLMACTHFPTRLSDPLGQPFGFVSAAEGFVLLSAYMAGSVYGRKALRDGGDAMRGALLRRALKVYACQAALLLFAYTVIAAIGLLADQQAVLGLLGLYFDRPAMALLSSLLLIYSPALLDILPIYIVLMLLSPVLLLHGRRRGWGGILALSTLLWLAAQFDAGPAVYQLLGRWVDIPVSYGDMGAFEILGWQFLWVMGLWLGADAGALPQRLPWGLVMAAALLALVAFVWRHAVGQTPFPGLPALAPLFDKWHLGPLRLINLFALLVLVLHFGPWLKRHLPRVAVLELLGRQSLPVFCAHLVVALLALALFGAADAQRALPLDLLLLVAGYAALYAVARAFDAVDRRAAARRGGRQQRQHLRRQLSG